MDSQPSYPALVYALRYAVLKSDEDPTHAHVTSLILAAEELVRMAPRCSLPTWLLALAGGNERLPKSLLEVVKEFMEADDRMEDGPEYR